MRRHRHHRGRRTPRRSASSTEWMSHQGAPSTGPASISSTPSPTPSCAPSSRSSPPRPAPARRPSAPGGGPSGAQLPSTSSPTVTSPARSVSASSTSRFSKILAEHSGPALRLSLPCIRRRYHGRIEGWLRSQALTDLQELHFGYGDDEILSRPPLPPSALRFAPTLRVASFSCCHFPDLSSQSLNFPHLSQLSLDKVTISDAVASLNFPCLKQLTMYDVAISGDALNSLLIGCLSLESLLMYLKFAIACLRISSPTLRSISFSAPYTKGLFQELVIEDAPCLERLLPLNPDYGPASVRVIHAPKLQVLGLLSKGISKLHIGATVFQEMTATSVITTMRSVKVLVIEIVGPNLGAVLGFLKCFPCLERLYVVSLLRMETKNVRKYDPVDPIECLELHLKRVVLQKYFGNRPDVDFAKFFVLNAKVLEEMKFGAINSCNVKWKSNQHRRLQVENRASPDARFEFIPSYGNNFTDMKHAHDLSMADPFERTLL